MARGKKQSKQVMDELVDSVASLKDAFKSIGEDLKQQITGNIQQADAATQRLARSVATDLTRSIRSYGKQSQQLLDNQEKLERGQIRSKDITKQLLQLKKEEARVRVDLEIAERNGYLTATERLKLEDELNRLLNEQTAELEAQKNIADKVLEKRRRLIENQKKGMEGYMDVISRINKIPLVGSLINAGKVQAKMNEYAKEYEEKTGKIAGKWKVIGVGILETFNSIGRSLLNPLNIITSIVGIITAIIKMVMDWEQKTFDIAKNLGVSVGYAAQLRSQFAGMASGALMSKDIAESFGKVNDALGFIGPATAGFAKTAAQLEKRIGGSAESMASLAKFGALSGKSLQQAYATAVGAARVAGMQNKLRLTERQILEEISKVSSAVLVTFKGNLPALAEAIVRAKKLGTTLDQLAKQGDGLLDFETSIAKQFEAEVMLGKELNLTRARELANQGKFLEMGEELKKQGVTLEEFDKQSTLAKQSYAEAMSSSVEEISKQLLLQKQLTELGAKEGESLSHRQKILLQTVEGRERLRKVMGEEAVANLEATSRAEMLEKTIERMKEKLAAMVSGPVLELVDKVTVWLSKSANIEKVAGVIKKVFEGINSIMDNLPKHLNKVAEVLRVIVSLAIAAAVANSVAGLAGIPGVGVALGIAAGLYIDQKLKSMMPAFEHGGISPGGPILVGERGPEIANLPAGSAIMNNGRTNNVLSTGGGNQKIEVTLNIDGEKVTKSVINTLPASPRANIDGRTSYG